MSICSVFGLSSSLGSIDTLPDGMDDLSNAGLPTSDRLFQNCGVTCSPSVSSKYSSASDPMSKSSKIPLPSIFRRKSAGNSIGHGSEESSETKSRKKLIEPDKNSAGIGQDRLTKDKNGDKVEKGEKNNSRSKKCLTRGIALSHEMKSGTLQFRKFLDRRKIKTNKKTDDRISNIWRNPIIESSESTAMKKCTTSKNNEETNLAQNLGEKLNEQKLLSNISSLDFEDSISRKAESWPIKRKELYKSLSSFDLNLTQKDDRRRHLGSSNFIHKCELFV